MPNTNSVKQKIVGWDNIDWLKVERYVFKQQKRIYTASRQGDIKQVRKLQRTLMRSWSNKALAVRRVTTDNRGKKTAGVDGVKNLSPIKNGLKGLYQEYYRKIGNRNWVFATKGANPLILLTHDDFSCSSTKFVKVKGDKSPYDGDLVYWSTRMGRNPELPNTKAFLLFKQKGKCNWCGLYFRNGDLLEKDHILATALGGKNEFNNYQLLHGGKCHNEKTAIDLTKIRDKRATDFIQELFLEWSKVNFTWINDIPVLVES